jgi:transcriptional regulator with XRE-family HTH domain
MRATNSYVVHITHGVAYELWRRVQLKANELGLTGVQVAEHTGIRRGTIDALKTSTRAPQPRIVNALAEFIGIDRHEAAILAGRVPADTPDAEFDVRIAIERSTAYTREQREMLLQLVELIEQANGIKGPDADDTGRRRAI